MIKSIEEKIFGQLYCFCDSPDDEMSDGDKRDALEDKAAREAGNLTDLGWEGSTLTGIAPGALNPEDAGEYNQYISQALQPAIDAEVSNRFGVPAPPNLQGVPEFEAFAAALPPNLQGVPDGVEALNASYNNPRTPFADIGVFYDPDSPIRNALAQLVDPRTRNRPTPAEVAAAKVRLSPEYYDAFGRSYAPVDPATNSETSGATAAANREYSDAFGRSYGPNFEVDDYNFKGMDSTRPEPAEVDTTPYSFPEDFNRYQRETGGLPTKEEQAEALKDFRNRDLNKDGKVSDLEKTITSMGWPGALIGEWSDLGRQSRVGDKNAGLDYEGEAYGTPDSIFDPGNLDGDGGPPSVVAPVAPQTCPSGYLYNSEKGTCEYQATAIPGAQPYVGAPFSPSTQYTGIAGLEPFVLQPTYTAPEPFEPMYKFN